MSKKNNNNKKKINIPEKRMQLRRDSSIANRKFRPIHNVHLFNRY